MKKNILLRSIIVLLVSLAASTAQAQLGYFGTLAASKIAEKANDPKAPVIPQPEKKAKIINITYGKNKEPLGTWNTHTLQLDLGLEQVLTIDPATGAVTAGDELVCTLGNDGTIQSMRGTYSVSKKNFSISKDGEVIGKALKTSCLAYGTELVAFDKAVSPLLMTLVGFVLFTPDEQLAELKAAQQERQARQAEQRALAAARTPATGGTKTSYRSSYMTMYLNGLSFGQIESDGTVKIRGLNVGRFESDGTIRVNGTNAGKIEPDGKVRKNGYDVGRIEGDGTVRINGSVVGRVQTDGNVYKNGLQIGKVEDMHDMRKVAIIYFFGFFNI